MTPKVSVIIPTIGRNTLIRSLESVLNQTFQDFEIIITDDTEDKKAKKLIEPFLKDERISYFVNKKYMHGPAGNKNNGLDHIRGEYFIFLDDDDVMFDNALESLLEIAEKYQYKIVFANCIDNVEKEFTGKHYNKSEEVSFKDFVCGKYEGDYSMLCKTEILESDRFYEKCWGGENLLWWKLWKKIDKGFYLHKQLMECFLILENRVTKRSVDYKISKRTFLNYKYLLDIFENDFKEFCPQAYSRIAIPGIFFAKISGNWREINRLIVKSIRINPKSFVYIVPWGVFCLIFPKKTVLFIYQKIFNKNFKEKIKKIILK